MNLVTRYVCDKCATEYKTGDSANRCEASHGPPQCKLEPYELKVVAIGNRTMAETSPGGYPMEISVRIADASQQARYIYKP